MVGEVSARIFGMKTQDNPATLTYARALGEALQLTNIIRDVGEDARRGRIYLPQSELAQFGVSGSSLFQGRAEGDFVGMMRFQHARCRYWRWMGWRDRRADACACRYPRYRF